jgi:hypothetical protein
MYMIDLRHIHDPVLSSLKMKGMRLLFNAVANYPESTPKTKVAKAIK